MGWPRQSSECGDESHALHSQPGASARMCGRARTKASCNSGMSGSTASAKAASRSARVSRSCAMRNATSAMSCASSPRIIFVSTRSTVAGRESCSQRRRSRDRHEMLLPRAAEEDLIFHKKMGHVEARVSQRLIGCPVGLPKLRVLIDQRHLRPSHDDVHIERGCRFGRRIGEAERDRRAPIEHQRHRVVQLAVERGEDALSVEHG